MTDTVTISISFSELKQYRNANSDNFVYNEKTRILINET